MLRLVHIFDLKQTANDESFLSWLDAHLYQAAKEFGCIDRKTWVFLDGLDDPYGKRKQLKKRPRYIIEAFWKSQKDADNFREWLTGKEGSSYRQNWNECVTNHSVLRYVDYAPPQNIGDD